MPQLVKSLSGRSSNSLVGLLVMIPHLVGLLMMIMVSRDSDRKLERKYHAAIPAIVGGIAAISLVATDSTFLSITLLSLQAVGVYASAAPFWALPSEFLTGFSAASGIALISSAANLGGFVGPYAVGLIGQRTGTLHGSMTLAGVCLLALATLVLLLPSRARS